MASLIKVVRSLQHEKIPPHLHLKQLNRYISLKGTSFSIPTECLPWYADTNNRLAGVSAFGFGGANAQVILEEAPEKFKIQNSPLTPQNEERSLHILTLKGKK